MENSFQHVAAVIDEVTLLETALREAEERKRNVGGNSALKPPDQRFDSAVASYGVQLRAWIDVQVDTRLGQVMHGLYEGEFVALRQENVATTEAIERFESEMRAVTEAQAKILLLVEGLSEELLRVKSCVNACQQDLQANTATANRAGATYDQSLSAFDKMRERVDTLWRSAEQFADFGRVRSRVEELSVIAESVNATQEKIAEFTRGIDSTNEQIATRCARNEEAILQLRNSLEAQAAMLSDARHLRDNSLRAQDAHGILERDVARAKEDLLGLERRLASWHNELVAEVSASASGRADLEHRFEDRLEALQVEAAGQVQALRVEVAGQVEALRVEVAAAAAIRNEIESRYGNVRSELEGKLESQIGVRLDAWEVERSRLEFRLASMRSEIEDRLDSQLKSRADLLKLEWKRDLKIQDESQSRLGEDLVALQQRLVSELRAETTAALNREAAAVAALDEQLWITDQRIGQRVDELQHLHTRMHRSHAAQQSNKEVELNSDWKSQVQARLSAKPMPETLDDVDAPSDSDRDRRRRSSALTGLADGLDSNLSKGMIARKTLLLGNELTRTTEEEPGFMISARTTRPDSYRRRAADDEDAGAMSSTRSALHDSQSPSQAKSRAARRACTIAFTEPVTSESSFVGREAPRISPRALGTTIIRSGGATEALTSSAERRELKELQARHRGSNALSMTARGMEEFADENSTN